MKRASVALTVASKKKYAIQNFRYLHGEAKALAPAWEQSFVISVDFIEIHFKRFSSSAAGKMCDAHEFEKKKPSFRDWKTH